MYDFREGCVDRYIAVDVLQKCKGRRIVNIKATEVSIMGCHRSQREYLGCRNVHSQYREKFPLHATAVMSAWTLTSYD